MKKKPVLLVTGFLGSGKTTFLNWLIHNNPDLKISLVLNEFGDVKLESQFIKEHFGEVAELSNGCMCCIAKSDIPRVVDLILEKSPQTEYIIIEASGLSDPDPIRDALQNSVLTQKIVLQSTICIVDALNFETSRNEHSIVMSQIGDADIIILSKVKEAGAETTTRIKGFIESIGVNTKVLLWNEDLNPDMFLNSPTHLDSHEEKHKEHEHYHEHEIYNEYWFKTDKEIDFAKLTSIMNNLPPSIIRSKGYANIDGKKIMIQYVSGKLETFDSHWLNESPHTAILFLSKNMIDPALEKELSACINE